MNIYSENGYRNYDKDACKLLMYGLMFSIMDQVIEGIFNKIGIFTSGISILTYGISIACILLCIFKYRGKILLKFTLSYVSIILFFVINYSIFKNTQIYYLEYWLKLRRMLIIYIPIAILVSYITDYSYFFKDINGLTRISLLIIILSIILGFIDYREYMVFSLYFLPIPILLYFNFSAKKSIVDLIFFMLSLGIMILYGGRSSLLSIFLFIILLSILKLIYKNKIKATIYVTFIISLLIIISFFRNQIISLLIYILDVFNINSRNIEVILQGNFLNFDTREYIFKCAINEIMNLNWYDINGIFGDRQLLRNYASWITYSHNIIFEIILSFGYIIGGILILSFCTKVVKIMLSKDIYKQIVVIMFICIAMTRLFVSGSFIIEEYFYLMLGVLWKKSNFYTVNKNNNLIKTKIN